MHVGSRADTKRGEISRGSCLKKRGSFLVLFSFSLGWVELKFSDSRCANYKNIETKKKPAQPANIEDTYAFDVFDK